MDRFRFGSEALTGMIACGLLAAAVSLATASSPALAYNPDAEHCHYEKKCELVTPYCPPQGQYHKQHPCQAPFTQCKNVKVCAGD